MTANEAASKAAQRAAIIDAATPAAITLSINDLVDATIEGTDAEQLQPSDNDWAPVLYLRLKDGRRATVLVLSAADRGPGTLDITDETEVTRQMIEEDMREIAEQYPDGILTGSAAALRMATLRAMRESLPKRNGGADA